MIGLQFKWLRELHESRLTLQVIVITTTAFGNDEKTVLQPFELKKLSPPTATVCPPLLSHHTHLS